MTGVIEHHFFLVYLNMSYDTMRNVIFVKKDTFFKVARPGVILFAVNIGIDNFGTSTILEVCSYVKEFMPKTSDVTAITKRNTVFGYSIAKGKLYILNERFNSNNLFCCLRI